MDRAFWVLPNEINLYYLLQLSDQADRDPEVAWKEWIAGKYGITDEESELILASALRKSYEVVRKVFLNLV